MVALPAIGNKELYLALNTTDGDVYELGTPLARHHHLIRNGHSGKGIKKLGGCRPARLDQGVRPGVDEEVNTQNSASLCPDRPNGHAD